MGAYWALSLLLSAPMLLRTFLLNLSPTYRSTSASFILRASLVRSSPLRREYQPALTPPYQQTRRITTKSTIPPSPLECYTTTAPMAQDFSCDWDKWSDWTFIRTLPDFTRITRVEFIFHRLYGKPTTDVIKPLTFNTQTNEACLAFKAGGKYYFWDGTWENLYEYAREDFEEDEFLMRFLDLDVEKEIVPPPSEERRREIGEAMQAENPRP
ncbi:hypothetical protein C8R46DRAFT_1351960 [Mycena filopes]|nr:hypothetical protein C8R46DRAFT_1351960 [Mycena filopes]